MSLPQVRDTSENGFPNTLFRVSQPFPGRKSERSEDGVEAGEVDDAVDVGLERRTLDAVRRE